MNKNGALVFYTEAEMNDYFSSSLLELNKTAFEHEHNRRNWYDAVRQHQMEENENPTAGVHGTINAGSLIKNLSDAFRTLAHSYAGRWFSRRGERFYSRTS